MKIETIQTSFVGGEFGPSLLGRVDVAQYKNAAALVQNWLIRPFGSIVTTPGLEYVNQCVTGGSTTIAGIRIIPFQFSVTDSYIIEMGVGYFQFYTNDGLVVSNSTAYQVSHTYASADISSVQYCQNHDVIYLFHGNYPPQTLNRYGSTNWTLTPFNYTGGPFMASNTSSTTITIGSASSGASTTFVASSAILTPSSSTVGHVGSFWSIGSTITSATTGLAVQGYVQITAITNPSTATCTVISALQTAGPTAIWAEGSWSAVRGYPARCTFFQSRLFAARTTNEPQTVWGSQSFVFNNFSVNGGADDDALNLQLSATQGNDVKWLAPMNDLIVGTYGGEFCISAGIGTGNPLTPSSVGVIQQTSWGSESVVPKKIGNFAYYIQRGFQKLREISYIWTSANYKSIDKTILSPQINGGGFLDIAYQQNPDTILWCLCTNGTLATMTREVDQDVQAWTRQVTAGSFASIAIIPSQYGPYDEVWAVVTRRINGNLVNYIERFASQLLTMQGTGSLVPQQDQVFYVHCGLTYNAFSATSSPTATSISIGAGYGTTGSTVVITSSAVYFVVGDVGDRLRAVDSFDNIQGEITITGYTSSTIIVGTVTYPFTAPSYSSGSWGVSVTNISGLNQLIGSTVVVCADGGLDYPSKVVSTAGTITLAYNYFVVTVGLQAVSSLLTLPQEAAAERGTAQGKKQRINEIAFKLNNSYTGFWISGTTGTLFQPVGRSPQTVLGVPPSLVTGILPNISFSDDYRYGSQVYITVTDPLPVEILNIITTLETFEK